MTQWGARFQMIHEKEDKSRAQSFGKMCKGSKQDC